MIERVIYTLLADEGSAAARNAKARTKAKTKTVYKGVKLYLT
jgi:hypothetical protein